MLPTPQVQQPHSMLVPPQVTTHTVGPSHSGAQSVLHVGSSGVSESGASSGAGTSSAGASSAGASGVVTEPGQPERTARSEAKSKGRIGQT